MTTTNRFPGLPDVPTIAELGYAKYNFSSWFGILAPAGTPKAIVERLQTEIIKALKHPSVQEKLGNYEIFGSTSEEFGSFIRTEIDKTAQIIKTSGASID